jgi:hypothetical protein
VTEATADMRVSNELTKDPGFAQWCVIELMGHRRLAGYVQEVQIGGASFLRLDVPASENGLGATQFYNPSAVYCLTPTSEETARAVATLARPEPVAIWELKP